MVFNFFFYECADIEQILEQQVLRKRVGFNQESDSNPGWLGGKREGYLCAVPSPHD